jgi:hypothetical protein
MYDILDLNFETSALPTNQSLLHSLTPKHCEHVFIPPKIQPVAGPFLIYRFISYSDITFKYQTKNVCIQTDDVMTKVTMSSFLQNVFQRKKQIPKTQLSLIT